MEGREKQHTVKYKDTANDWNYDASCTLTSLSVWEHFKRLISVAQNVQQNKHNGHLKLAWCVLCFRKDNYQCDIIKGDATGKARSSYGRHEKCINNFSRKT
jgi:hypothetical protein